MRSDHHSIEGKAESEGGQGNAGKGSILSNHHPGSSARKHVQDQTNHTDSNVGNTADELPYSHDQSGENQASENEGQKRISLSF